MFKKNPALMSWSGGKDSALALFEVLNQQQLDVRYLLTTVNSVVNRIAIHGVRESLLLKQAQQLNIPLLQLGLPEMPDEVTYESMMGAELSRLRATGITHAIYGDIFLEDLRSYREKQLAACKIKPVFPLWKRESSMLIRHFIDLGFKTVVVCTQDGLQEFCGREIDHQFLKDLPKNIDPCGENGEFHTFVFDGPIFKDPISFTSGELIYKSLPHPTASSPNRRAGFWYRDIR